MAEEAEDELAARRRLREAVARMDAEVKTSARDRRRRLFGTAQITQITKILILIVALVFIVAFRAQCGDGVVSLFDTLAPPAAPPR
jgi:hypothetical protein